MQRPPELATSAATGMFVSAQRRRAVLAGVPVFAGLRSRVVAELADAMVEHHVAAGAVVLHEGDFGSDLYLLVEGRAVVTVAGAAEQVVVGQVHAGEMFGELAILDDEQRRSATVTAETSLLLLVLSAAAFSHILTRFPEVRDRLHEAREQLLLTRFLKASSPFAVVDAARVREMTMHLRHIHVPADTVILRQDDEGETCYLLRSGRVLVTMRDVPRGEAAAASDRNGNEREVATLLPGMLFGEAALLTMGRRNATVRALEDCEVLEIRRSDLLLVLGANEALRSRVIELMHLRDRPRAAAGILVQERTSHAGETIITLKNPRSGAYYRLSRQGYFVWQRLDGRHNLRDLALEYMVTFKSFAPQTLAELIAGLREAGFVDGSVHLPADVATARAHRGRAPMLIWLHRVLEWQVTIPGVDAALGWLCAAGLRLLYTRVGQALLALIALGGLVAFSLLTVRDGAQFAHIQFGGWFLLVFGLAYVFSVLIHELGHGLTAKAFGHEVLSGGVGWFRLGPTAFVDTSDLWMAEPWPRIATSLAGPYANLLLGSLAALVALGHGYGIAQAALWQFALTSYGLVLFNLNPLTEYDGYFILIDLLGIANLKQRSLHWLGSVLTKPGKLRELATVPAQRLYLLYSVGAIGYIVVVTFLVVASYRLVLQSWVEFVIPAGLASVLAWAVALGVVAVGVAEIVDGMRGERARAGATTAG